MPRESDPSPVAIWVLAVLSFAVFYSTETTNGEIQRRIIVPVGIIFGVWCLWLVRRAAVRAREREAPLPTSLRAAGVVAVIGITVGVLQTVLLTEWSTDSDATAAPTASPTSIEGGTGSSAAASDVPPADACALLTPAEAEAFLGVAPRQEGPTNQTVSVEGEPPRFSTSTCTYAAPGDPGHQIAIFLSRRFNEEDFPTQESIEDNCPPGERVDDLGTAAVWFDPACATRGLAESELVIANGRDFLSVAVDEQATLEQTEALAGPMVDRSSAQQRETP